MRGLIALTCLALLTGCAGSDSPEADATATPPSTSPASPTTAPTTTSDQTPQTPAGPAGEVVDTVATGLEVPWGLTFLPDGTALVGERGTGLLFAIEPDGTRLEAGWIAATDAAGEGGLLGLAASPTFASDRTVYAYVTTREDNRVVRFVVELGGEQPISDPEPILTGIPKAGNHNGGGLLFDRTGNLLVATGDAADTGRSQSRRSLAGKILRITPDGEPAPGNPDPDSPLWSWGHRNVQGLAIDDAGRLWASEFGQNTWDELNRIEPGGNYGWPDVEGDSDDTRYRAPLQTWRTSEASPSGLAYANGSLWMAGLRGERLWQIPINPDGSTGTPRAHLVGEYGRLRAVAVAPDGNLWVTTSNRDGRGRPASRDDRILVVSVG